MKKLFPIICLLCAVFIIPSCKEEPPVSGKNFFENTHWELVKVEGISIFSTTLSFDADKFTLTIIEMSYADYSSSVTTYSGTYSFENLNQAAQLYITSTQNGVPSVTQMIVYTFDSDEKLRIRPFVYIFNNKTITLDNVTLNKVTGKELGATGIPARLESSAWLKRDIVDGILLWEEKLDFQWNTYKYALKKIPLIDEKTEGFYVYDKKSGKGALLYEVEVVEVIPSESEGEEDITITRTAFKGKPFIILDNKLTFADEDYFLEKIDLP